MTADPLLVLAPLRIEQWSIGTGVPTRRTGMGRRNSLRAAAALRDGADGRALAVVGFGAAVDPRLRAGDIVVATEIRGAGSPETATEPERLAAALRSAPRAVYTGPIVTAERMVNRARREQLGETGALLADLESAHLLAGTRAPQAAIRVVVDTVRFPVVHPRTVPAGLVAMRSLRLLVPALREWADGVVRSGDPVTRRNTSEREV